MVTLLAAFLLGGIADVLPYLHVRVDAECYRKLFEKALVRHDAGIDIGANS